MSTPGHDFDKALELLAQTTTTLRDLHVGYQAEECCPTPEDCIAQVREFFDRCGLLDEDTARVWDLSH
jgi:hypothetical protein